MFLSLDEKFDPIETIPFIKCLFEQLRYFKGFWFSFGNFSCSIIRIGDCFIVELRNKGVREFLDEYFKSLEAVLDVLKRKCQLEEPTNLIVSLNKCSVQ